MGLFDSNRVYIRSILERNWRELAQMAIRAGVLHAKKGTLELKLTLRVQDGGVTEKFSMATTVHLQASGEPTEKRKRGKTVWQRLMEPEDL